MKEELGLNRFEGRSWRGFHHHACRCCWPMVSWPWNNDEQRRPPESPGNKSEQEPRITLPAIPALQRFLMPRAKPDSNHCNPFYHLLFQRSHILTE